MVHATYLANVCNGDKEKHKQSLDLLVAQAEKCAKVGVGHYVFHPGNGKLA